MKTQFMWLALRGIVEPIEIADFVEAWNTLAEPRPILSEFLGLSEEQYDCWRKNPNSIQEIVEGTRTADQLMIKKLYDALSEYGCPEFYHGILVMGDPPCGGFIDDHDDCHNHPDYPGDRFGASARRAIAYALEVPYGV